MSKRLQFVADQIMIRPENAAMAMELLTAMGCGRWYGEHVVSAGGVFDDVAGNESEHAINKNTFSGPCDLQVVDYTSGANWMDVRPDSDPHRVGCLSMQVTEKELQRWRRLFHSFSIDVVQEMTAQVIPDSSRLPKRQELSVVFDTHAILSVDIRFMVISIQA